MKEGARILVNECAGVQLGEEVAVVADRERRGIADALLKAVLAAGGTPSLILPPARSIDNEEPSALVASALKGAQVVFLPVTLAMAHTRAVREAIGDGSRVVSMTAFTERMMREGGLFTDFRARRPVCQALADRLTSEVAAALASQDLKVHATGANLLAYRGLARVGWGCVG